MPHRIHYLWHTQALMEMWSLKGLLSRKLQARWHDFLAGSATFVLMFFFLLILFFLQYLSLPKDVQFSTSLFPLRKADAS